jgi:uncharacterized protein (DUF302 family)
MDPSDDYGYSVEVAEGYDEAVTRARLALRAEGFSILTEAHVGEVLDPSMPHGRQYLIMSAWAPAMGHGDSVGGVQVAVHLPCNLVVQETGDSALVAALDPAADAPGRDATEESLASDAREALGRVLGRIGSR